MPKEFSWKNDNGNRIYAIDWNVEGARAVIGLVHGVGEHCRRYDHVAHFFNAHGIAMVGYDRQGNGRSEGKRGFAKDWREYVDEVAQLRLSCERRYPNVPAFLYGHSMGGQVLLYYLIRRNPNIRAAVVSAPHVRLNFQPNALKVAAGKLLRGLKPDFAMEAGLDLDLLSRNPAVRPAYEADENVDTRVTAQTGIDNLERAAFLDTYADGLPVPTLMMHGDADGVTSHAASREFAERNAKVTFKSWPGLYHELHNEPEREEVLKFVLKWLESRLLP